jgi:hypothetical protein
MEGKFMNRHELLPLLQLIILAWPLQAQTVKEVAAFELFHPQWHKSTLVRSNILPRRKW